MREQKPQTFEVWTLQAHYVPHILEIPVDLKALRGDDDMVLLASNQTFG